jgi:hypothetical protein
MFEKSVRAARDRALRAVSGYLEPGESVEAVAAGLEDYRVGRSLLIVAVPLLPILFVMELNGVTGLIQSVTIGVIFGVVAYVEQIRRSRQLILTDRRLLVLGSTWNLRPGELLGAYRRGELALIGAEDAAYGMRSLTIRRPDQTELEYRFARPSRDAAAQIEARLTEDPRIPSPLPPPPPGSSGPSATLPDVPGV